MSRKIVLKNYEKFKGLNLSATPLTLGADEASNTGNVRFGEGNSLRKRFGSQAVGQNLGLTRIFPYKYRNPQTGNLEEKLIGVGSNVYELAKETLTLTRLSGSNHKLVMAPYSPTPTTGNFKLQLYLDGALVNLTNPITGVSFTRTDLGTGWGHNMAETDSHSVFTVWHLAQLLNSNVNFSCTYPTQTGILDVDLIASPGNNANILRRYTFEAGHTFILRGIIATFENGITPSTVTQVNSLYPIDAISTVVAVAGNDVDFSMSGIPTYQSDYFTLNRVGTVIGRGASPAASIQITEGITETGATTLINYYYWKPIPMFTYTGKGDNSYHYANSPRFNKNINKLPVAVNQSNLLYFYGEPDDIGFLRKAFYGRLLKYDGQNLYRAGVPSYKAPFFYNLAGGAYLSVGNYRYSIRYVYKDKQGNIFKGNPSHFYNDFKVTTTAGNTQVEIGVATNPLASLPSDRITTITATGAGATIPVTAGHPFRAKEIVLIRRTGFAGSRWIAMEISSVTGNSITGYDPAQAWGINNHIIAADNLGYNTESGYGASGVGSAANPLVLSGDAAGWYTSFEVGDVIYTYDTGKNYGIERTIIGTSFSGGGQQSIWWDTDKEPALVADAGTYLPIVSKNFRIEIFRTEVGGNIFYKIASLPIDSNAGASAPTSYLISSFIDRTPDTELGEEMDVPEVGRELDPPPLMALGCSHQGRLVGIGNRDRPNTLYWSLPENIEAFPEGETEIDIVSNNASGGVTALASDTDDRLAVFKEAGYYDVQGSLESIPYIKIVTEGDYGVSSQASLVKIKDWLIGVGRFGPIRVQNGQLETDRFKVLRPKFLNNSDFNFNNCPGYNVSTRNEYRMFCNLKDADPSTLQTQANKDKAFSFVYDYESDTVFHDSFHISSGSNQEALTDAGGGWAEVNGKVYHLNSFYDSLSYNVGAYAFTMTAKGQLYREMDLDQLVTYNTAKTSSIITSPGYLYHDASFPIEGKLSQVYHLGTPSLRKAFLRYKIYSLFIADETGYRTVQTNTINIYKDFNITSLFDSFVLTLPLTSGFEMARKLKSNNARSLQIDIINNVAFESFHVTGIELLVAAIETEEDIV